MNPQVVIAIDFRLRIPEGQTLDPKKQKKKKQFSFATRQLLYYTRSNGWASKALISDNWLVRTTPNQFLIC